MKAVPQFIPQAPNARAAARPRPVAKPPDAMKGTLSSRAAMGRRTMPPISSCGEWKMVSGCVEAIHFDLLHLGDRPGGCCDQ
jgi:hypothetical protein